MKFTIGLLLGLLVGCASTIGTDILQFKDREFLPHPDLPAMSFPYDKEVCVPRIVLGVKLGNKCHVEHVEENYDFNDKAVRHRFLDAGCSMKCAGRFEN